MDNSYLSSLSVLEWRNAAAKRPRVPQFPAVGTAGAVPILPPPTGVVFGSLSPKSRKRTAKSGGLSVSLGKDTFLFTNDKKVVDNYWHKTDAIKAAASRFIDKQDKKRRAYGKKIYYL